MNSGWIRETAELGGVYEAARIEFVSADILLLRTFAECDPSSLARHAFSGRCYCLLGLACGE